MFSSFVAPTCPPNSQYSQCANTCEGSCAKLLTPFACNKACFEGCQCNPGFLFDGDRCVKVQQCGCVHEGKYLTVKLIQYIVVAFKVQFSKGKGIE